MLQDSCSRKFILTISFLVFFVSFSKSLGLGKLQYFELLLFYVSHHWWFTSCDNYIMEHRFNIAIEREIEQQQPKKKVNRILYFVYRICSMHINNRGFTQTPEFYLLQNFKLSEPNEIFPRFSFKWIILYIYFNTIFWLSLFFFTLFSFFVYHQ